jgi:hypothetical protein
MDSQAWKLGQDHRREISPVRQFEDKPDNPHRRAEDRNSHDCAYQVGEMRCQYPGAISLNTTGGGPYYCRVHIRERGTLFARQALEASQGYRAPVVAEDTSWLDENFPMQPGESRQEYCERCRAYALSMLGTFRPKPVVNTEPARIREPGEDLVEM